MIFNAGIASICAVIIGVLAFGLGGWSGLLALGAWLITFAILEAVRKRVATA